MESRIHELELEVKSGWHGTDRQAIVQIVIIYRNCFGKKEKGGGGCTHSYRSHSSRDESKVPVIEITSGVVL